jgi:hypothetical protein
LSEQKCLTWQAPKRKRKPTQGKEQKKKTAHYMETETSAYCGRQLVNSKSLPTDWKPEEHLDCVCQDCLEWYRLVNKPCKVKEKTHPAPSNTA